jgi:putative toxin-antitoxin system antitoxin component (TIGR02293 family)
MATLVTPLQILGGERTLGKKAGEPFGLNARIRTGLPYSSLESLAKTLSMSREEISKTLSIPIRTLARRKRESKLTPEESDRLYRAARVLANAVRLLGDEESAAGWLRSPHVALGMATPFSMLDTSLGADQVEEILGRIEYGMYS